jgi:hypothetical protein
MIRSQLRIMIKIITHLLTHIILFIGINTTWAQDLKENKYNEYMAITDIQVLNKLNTNPDAVHMARREMRDNITEFVVSNLDLLIDNKYSKAKAALQKELPELPALLNLSENMQVTNLSKDLLLITLQMEIGAYQSVGLFLIYDQKNIKLFLAPFETLESTKTVNANLNNKYKFINFLNFKIIDDNFLQFISESRGVGDCGVITTYQFSDGEFKLFKSRDFACAM